MRWFLLITISVFFLSCEKSAIEKSEELAADLHGNWEITAYSNGELRDFTGHELTIRSDGQNVWFDIVVDDKEYTTICTIIYYEDIDSQISIGNFGLDGDSKQVFLLGTYGISGDTKEEVVISSENAHMKLTRIQ